KRLRSKQKNDIPRQGGSFSLDTYLRVVMPGFERLIRSKVVEPKPFCQPVEPVLFRDFVAGVVLRRASAHGVELRESRAADGRVLGMVSLDELLEKVRPLKH